MPRFDFNPSKVQAGGIEVFPTGDYEFIIGEPKAFKKVGEKGENFGIRVALTIAEGEYAGKRTIHSMYLHSEAAQPMVKQFMMAAMGFGRKDEKEFNAATADEDFSADFDAGVVGDGWMKLKGQRIIGTLSVQPRQDDPSLEQQQFKTWLPFSN